MNDFKKYTFKTKQNFKKVMPVTVQSPVTKAIIKIYIDKQAVKDLCQSFSGILYINHTLILLLENNILSRYILYLQLLIVTGILIQYLHLPKFSCPISVTVLQKNTELTNSEKTRDNF